MPFSPEMIPFDAWLKALFEVPAAVFEWNYDED